MEFSIANEILQKTRRIGMLKVGEIYEGLDFLGTEEMGLFNPSDKLEQPCFFIKES